MLRRHSGRGGRAWPPKVGAAMTVTNSKVRVQAKARPAESYREGRRGVGQGRRTADESSAGETKEGCPGT